jgi:hypothetical protein
MEERLSDLNDVILDEEMTEEDKKELDLATKKSDFSYKEVVSVDDDFVVPMNFEEFNNRYPKYIKTWLIRHRCPNELLEDFTHDMVEYILTVSKNGQAKGIKDRIMSFSGDRIGGKSAGKFFFYINLLLTRKYMICIRKRTREPITQRNTLMISFDAPESAESYVPGTVTLEDLFTKHNCSHLVDLNFADSMDTTHFVKGFVKFLKKNEPDTLKTATLFMQNNSMSEICEVAGLKMEELNRLKSRLRILASVYSKGLQKIPNKRKIYTRKTSKV